MTSTTTPTCTRAELAQRSGVDEAYIDRLGTLGILTAVADEGTRFRATDVRRIAIIRALESGGVGLEGIGEAFRNGSVNLEFMEQASYDRFGSFADETFEEVAARTGVPLQIVLTIREGRNRQVRRMLQAVGHRVHELRRVGFGPLKLGRLKPGGWRVLVPAEVAALRRSVGIDLETTT